MMGMYIGDVEGIFDGAVGGAGGGGRVVGFGGLFCEDVGREGGRGGRREEERLEGDGWELMRGRIGVVSCV
jgi:hypothetical protein